MAMALTQKDNTPVIIAVGLGGLLLIGLLIGAFFLFRDEDATSTTTGTTATTKKGGDDGDDDTPPPPNDGTPPPDGGGGGGTRYTYIELNPCIQNGVTIEGWRQHPTDSSICVVRQDDYDGDDDCKLEYTKTITGIDEGLYYKDFDAFKDMSKTEINAWKDMCYTTVTPPPTNGGDDTRYNYTELNPCIQNGITIEGWKQHPTDSSICVVQQDSYDGDGDCKTVYTDDIQGINEDLYYKDFDAFEDMSKAEINAWKDMCYTTVTSPPVAVAVNPPLEFNPDTIGIGVPISQSGDETETTQPLDIDIPNFF